MKEFEINCRIQGKGNYNADCGDLKNIESVSKNIIEGTYTFYVAAESSEEALKAAPNVFSSIWENTGIDCGELRDTDLSSYRDDNKEAFRISDSSELSHFTVRDKNSGITLDAYTGAMNDYDSFYITVNGETNAVTFENMTKNYEIAEMNEAVANKGFDNCIFPEYYAPYASTEKLSEYISDRKDTIVQLLEVSDVSKVIGIQDYNAHKARPDLYNDYYEDEAYSDGIRCVYAGIVENNGEYMFDCISVEMLDMTVVQFTLNDDKNSYDMNMLIELYTGNRDGKLNEYCRSVIKEALILQNSESLKHITEKVYRLDSLLDTIKDMPAGAVVHADEYLDDVVLTIRKSDNFRKGIIMETVLEDETNEVSVQFELNGKAIANTRLIPVNELEKTLNDIKNGDSSALWDSKKSLKELIDKSKTKNEMER